MIMKREKQIQTEFIGPRTEPCGTPHNKLAKSDIIPSISTLCVRSQTKTELAVVHALPLILTYFSSI